MVKQFPTYVTASCMCDELRLGLLAPTVDGEAELNVDGRQAASA